MAKKAASKQKPSLKTVLRRLNPNVPAGAEEKGMPRVPRDSSALRQIRTRVSADPYAKVLLSGHIGVGKSTELLRLAKEMKPERWVIQCSVGQTLGGHNVNTFSLLVVLIEASIRSWTEELGEIPPGLVEELVGHIRELLPPEKRPGEPANSGPPETLRDVLFANLMLSHKILDRPLRRERLSGHKLSSLYRDVVQRMALQSVSVRQVLALDASPIAASCELVLKELEDAAGKPVLVLIDDLDKVRDEEIRDDVFLNRAMAWLRLPCGIVSTLPLDAIFSSIGRELDQVWGDVQVLDPLPVPNADAETLDDPALQPYLSMLQSIGAQEVFSALQCRRLANASTGLPRMFVSLCAACVQYSLDSKQNHVRDYHLDLAVSDYANRWRGRLDESDYQALVDVIDTEGSNLPKALHLLRDGILVRDGSAPPEEQVRLPAWAEPFVESYRQRIRRKQSSAS